MIKTVVTIGGTFMFTENFVKQKFYEGLQEFCTHELQVIRVVTKTSSCQV